MLIRRRNLFVIPACPSSVIIDHYLHQDSDLFLISDGQADETRTSQTFTEQVLVSAVVAVVAIVARYICSC
jgi:hypothetical protein